MLSLSCWLCNFIQVYSFVRLLTRRVKTADWKIEEFVRDYYSKTHANEKAQQNPSRKNSWIATDVLEILLSVVQVNNWNTFSFMFVSKTSSNLFRNTLRFLFHTNERNVIFIVYSNTFCFVLPFVYGIKFFFISSIHSIFYWALADELSFLEKNHSFPADSTTE